MPRIDRLSALMARFELSVEPCTQDHANLWILGTAEDPHSLLLTRNSAPLAPSQNVLAFARVTWGGDDNPLLSALPGEVHQALDNDPEMKAISALFVAELAAKRCGVASVLNRLGEVLIVRLMRAQIEAGSIGSSLLAALADPRLSRAVVAIHDRPDHAWRLESLADEAGLSPSRFSDLFRWKVGQTPLAYLRRWRLILAKQDIARGERIQRVAARYCYGSPEALSRAFTAQFGCAPSSVRSSVRAAIKNALPDTGPVP